MGLAGPDTLHANQLPGACVACTEAWDTSDRRPIHVGLSAQVTWLRRAPGVSNLCPWGRLGPECVRSRHWRGDRPGGSSEPRVTWPPGPASYPCSCPFQAQRPALEAAAQVQQRASAEGRQPDQPDGHTHQHPQAEGWVCGGPGTVRQPCAHPSWGPPSSSLGSWPVSLGPQTWRGQAVGTASKTGEGGPDIHMGGAWSLRS